MPGEWELVVDQYPFFGESGAPFDPATDLRGEYFTVSNAPIVFSCDPAAIKAAAAASAADAALIHQPSRSSTRSSCSRVCSPPRPRPVWRTSCSARRWQSLASE
jgi:hypothetical protein